MYIHTLKCPVGPWSKSWAHWSTKLLSQYCKLLSIRAILIFGVFMIKFLLMVGQSVSVETSGLSARHSPVWLSHILPPQLHAGGKRKGFWEKNIKNVQLSLPRLVTLLYLGLCVDIWTNIKNFLDWFSFQYIEKGVFYTGQIWTNEIWSGKQNENTSAEITCSKLGHK